MVRKSRGEKYDIFFERGGGSTGCRGVGALVDVSFGASGRSDQVAIKNSEAQVVKENLQVLVEYFRKYKPTYRFLSRGRQKEKFVGVILKAVDDRLRTNSGCLTNQESLKEFLDETVNKITSFLRLEILIDVRSRFKGYHEPKSKLFKICMSNKLYFLHAQIVTIQDREKSDLLAAAEYACRRPLRPHH